MQQKPTTISQYRNAKSENTDCIVFFRLGGFYVMFEKDALIASKVLNLKMISKNPGGGELPSCGVPTSALEQYISKLVKSGYPVAICDQIGEETESTGIRKRAVTKVVKPDETAPTPSWIRL